ncbi:GNAT family N-acetyltransferase [Bacillus wiedmannii]|uniref:GNAT family N-acetyltransferase n=1 Tax=Bacillus wiedmannii TaxID=1890302 RepID=UPI000BED3CA5|nr:GNAT family protein [Bacillus wiedmannii]PDZ69996.1 GNAT family N-acetyltransferase [Bacillus cereus]PEI70764.1 GNAT family N-acetyltransferase [Bacillus wiedmannii]PEK61756.1 GNAT family N-acetyltransferase [Bacillus wiedmannii]PEL21259.1 GNAT family N-acetyltransferase [Bacillus wiedmannii]PEL61158.1 GNAT family N-acetyltransferase [Bacillus wiedmannii]
MRLESKRIYLRPLCQLDAPIILESTTDDEIRYMTGTKSTFSLEQIKTHIDHINNDSSRYDFAICLKSTEEMIGELSILDIDEENKRAVFRISMLSIALTGQGYGTEAITIVLKFVFEQLYLNRLQLEVFSHNLRGIRAYEKVGFVKEGTLRQSLFYNDTFSDEIIMAILKSDYKDML